MRHLPLSIDPSAQDAHALYDAGLVSAADKVATHLAERRVAGQSSYDYRHEQLWRPTWAIVPVAGLESTIEEYSDDMRTRLERVLVEKKLAETKELGQRDIGRVMQHWAHTFVLHGAQLHRQSEAALALAPTSDIETVLSATRVFMWRISAMREILMTSPAHPLWGKKGRPWEDEDGLPIWNEEATKNAAGFVRRLLGSSMNIAKTTEGPIIEVMQEAGPELLTVDRGYLAEIDSEPRQKLIAHLRGLASFTPQDRKKAVELIADIWDATNMADTTKAMAAEEEGKPGVFEGTVAETYGAYFNDVIPSDGKLTAEQKAMLERRMPIMGLLLLRSYLEDDTAMIGVVGKAMQTTLKQIVLRTPLSRLSLAAYTAMMDECTPRDLLATI